MTDLLLSHWEFLFFALLFDVIFGDPTKIFGLIPHPIAFLGKSITFMEKKLYPAPNSSSLNLFIRGSCLTIFFILFAYFMGEILDQLNQSHLILQIFLIPICSLFFAQTSLWQHVRHVYNPLRGGHLQQAREKLSLIVGRKTQGLDHHSISRASIESLAENFSDGIVAPTIWFCLGGFKGLLIYKTINTLDSMIGHRNPKYLYFGKLSARLDDLINLIPSRIGGCYITLACLMLHGPKQAKKAFMTMLTQAKKHNSPNAGWLEAPMAGALNIKLAGPRVYGNVKLNAPYLGIGTPDATHNHIHQALKIFVFSCIFNGLFNCYFLYISKTV